MAKDTGKFKDVCGRWMTSGLFYETATNKEFAVTNLEEAKKNYIECGDVTGYLYAEKYMGGWQHWKAIMASPVMEPIIEEWNEELVVKQRAQAILRIDLAGAEGNFGANKYIAEEGWSKNKVGRPSKEEKQKALAKEKRIRETVSEFLRPVRD